MSDDKLKEIVEEVFSSAFEQHVSPSADEKAVAEAAARLILAAREERDNEQRCRKEDADYLQGLISEWKFDHEKAVEERDDLQAQWADVANSLLNTKSQLRETQEKLEQLFRKASEDMAVLRSERDNFFDCWKQALETMTKERNDAKAQEALTFESNREWVKLNAMYRADRDSWHKIADERAAELVRVSRERDDSAELHEHVLHEVCTERDIYSASLKAQAVMINEYLKRIAELEASLEHERTQTAKAARTQQEVRKTCRHPNPHFSSGGSYAVCHTCGMRYTAFAPGGGYWS